MKKRKNLFFDFDGLKFDTIPALARYMNKRYGIDSKESDYVNMGSRIHEVIKRYLPDLSITRDEVYLDYNTNFTASIECHEDVRPMPGMVESVTLLSDIITLWSVTRRPPTCGPVMGYLFDKYIPGCINGIYHTWENGRMTSKVDFMLSVPGEKLGFVDDSLHEVEEATKTIPSYLYDPKEAYTNTNGILRFKAWSEITETFMC